MNDFNSIIIKTRCTVILNYGDSSACTIDERDEKINWINVSVRNGELTIYTKPNYYGYLLMHGCYPKVMVTFNKLTALRMQDKCFVTSAKQLLLQQLGIIVKEGRLEIAVEASCIDCTILKGGYVKIYGETIISRVLMYHKSIYKGANLNSSEGQIHVHDEGKASVWVTDELELGIYGRGKITYRGNPKIRILQINRGSALKQINTTTAK